VAGDGGWLQLESRFLRGVLFRTRCSRSSVSLSRFIRCNPSTPPRFVAQIAVFLQRFVYDVFSLAECRD